MKSDKEFILTHDEWPNWPLLPLKRGNEHGFILVGNFTLYLGNFWCLDDLPGETIAEKTKDWQKLEYGNVDSLLSDGWRVD